MKSGALSSRIMTGRRIVPSFLQPRSLLFLKTGRPFNPSAVFKPFERCLPFLFPNKLKSSLSEGETIIHL